MSGKYASPSPAPPTAPPPAATQEVKPPVTPVQPPQPAVTQEVQPGTPPSTPVSPAAQPSLVGVKSSVPVNLPEALAPSPQPVTPPAPGSEEKPLYVKAWDAANGLAANIEKPVIDVFHGFAKGIDDLIARGGLLANGEWKAALMGDNKPVPAYLSQITGAVPKAFGVEEAAKASSGASKFVGGLLGALAAYMMPGGASAKFAKATEAAPLAQKFISNLLTFATTDTLSAAGRGESPEQVRAAFLKSIPTAALFTVAQAVPFDRITKSPWMQRALESTATGTAFAGSHALGGETDPLALATSFATGFLLHGVQSTIAEGLPQRQKEGGLKIDWAATEQTRIYDEFKKQWMEEHKVSEGKFNQDVQPVLDEVAKPLHKTPQPEAPTPEAQKEAIFGGDVKDLIEGKENRADAVQALVPKIGDQARAEQFYDLYQKGDAETALKEFPELASWATEQQKAAQKGPEVPEPEKPTTPAPPMATAGHVSEDMGKPPAPKATEPSTPDSSSLPGAVAKGPEGFVTSEKPTGETQTEKGKAGETQPVEPKSPAAPAIAGGDMTEVLGAKLEEIAVQTGTKPGWDEVMRTARERGLGTLFKAGEEAAFTRGLTTEQIQGRLEKGGTVSELGPDTFPPESPYARGWVIREKSGQLVMVKEAKDGSLKMGFGETLGKDYEALGVSSTEGKIIAGSHTPFSMGSFIEVAKGQGIRTVDHELWHRIEHFFLTDKERAAVIRDFGDNEEVRAEAYAKWNPKVAPNTVFQKILDFFQRMAKALTGYQTGEDVFAKARSGELFGREAKERGLPEALAPTRMKAEDIAKPELSKAITRGELTLEEYNARYADKYGEWDSAEWAKNFPDFAAMGVRMAREDGTVVTERKYKVDDDAETRQGWIERGETPSFKQFKSEMDKDGEALYRRYIQPGNQEIPLYQGEKFTSRAGNQILDEKGKVRFLSKQEIFDRFYDPQRPLQQPEGTEAVGRNPLIPPEGTVEPPPNQTTQQETPGKLAAIRRNWNENMSIRNVSKLSDLAQTSVVEHLGWAAREMEKAVTVLDKYDKLFKNMSQEDLMAFTDKAESGQLDQVSPELQEAAQAWRRIADGIHFLIANEKGGEFAYWQDWFPRMFKDPARAEAAIQAFFKSHGATMTGPEGMLKARTQLLLSNSIKPVAEGGLGLELAYPNYVDMMKAKVHESLRYLTGTYIKNDLVEAGFLQKAKEKLERGVAQPEKIPGWVELQDKSLRGYSAHPDVALVLDNFLSRGLRGNALFDAIDNPSSALRELFVGLSAFHGFFTTLSDLSEGVGSHLPRAIGAALTGRFDAAGSHIFEMGKALNVPGNLMGGGKLIEEYRKPGTHPELSDRVDLMQRGGIRVNAQEFSKMTQAFSDALRDSKLSLPRKVIQAISSPIMNYFVPRIKINAIDRRLTMELGRFREQEGRAPTREEETKIAQDVSREMDNIFGQMVYDNLGMKRAMRDVLRLAIGFPGWNIGSGSLMLESAKGIGHLINETRLAGTEALTGQKTTWEPMGRKARMSMEFYTGMTIVTAVAGALTMKMLTGNWPGDVKDVFMPQTGGTLANGQPERVRMPTYMRDILSLNHPVDMVAHKSNFPLRMFQALTSNQDYFGEQIRDPYATVGKQAQQTGEYVGKSFLPFAIQGFLKAETPQSKALNLVGITPVPREYSNSPAGNIIDEYNKLNRATTTTKESAETKRLKADLMKLAKNQDESGFEEAAGQAVEAGKITRQQVKEIVAESQVPPGVSRFTRLPLEWATRAYDAGSDYEKEQWKPYFLKKVMSEKPENLIKNREAVVDTLKEMGLDEAADAVANLVMPEEPVAGIDLAGLGIQKAAPEMGGMEGVDTAIVQALDQNLKGKEKPTRVSMRSPSIREKKSKFDILGL